MTTGPKPPPSKADAMYSAPRTAPPYSTAVAGPSVSSVGYSPNKPTPGGAENGQSPKQGKMPV